MNNSKVWAITRARQQLRSTSTIPVIDEQLELHHLQLLGNAENDNYAEICSIVAHTLTVVLSVGSTVAGCK